MAITEQQWGEIKTQLHGTHGEVVLRLEDVKITLSKQLISESQLAICVYLNGEIKSSMGQSDFPERFNPVTALLWHKRTRAIYPPSRRKKILKTFTKKDLKARNIDLDKKHLWYEPFFTKFGPLKTQYSTLDKLEVISIGYQAKSA
ncbi:hypothetical protein ACU6U9_02665 [Pseudomonas sp. HK3]